MSASRDPDITLATWLDEGPEALSSGTRRAIKVAARTTPQARPGPLGLIGRRPTMTRYAPLAGVAAVIVIAFGAIAIGMPRSSGSAAGSVPSVAPSPSLPAAVTPSPAASPSAVPVPSVGALPPLLDTTAWRTYRSSRYGFSVAYPPDWQLTPSVHQWTFPSDDTWPSPGWDHFLKPGAGDASLGVGIFSVPVAPGTTVDSWLAANPYTGPIDGIDGRAVAVTMDGHPAVYLPFTDDSAVFSVVGNRIWAIVCGRPAGTDNSVQLVETFLSTMRLPAAGWTPSASPSASGSPSPS